MHKLIIILMIGILWSAVPAAAAGSGSPPVPARKTEAPGALKARIESEKSEQTNLKKKMASAEGELESARKSLVKISADMQHSQKTMADIESSIKKMESEQENLNIKIQSDYGSMAI